MLALNVDSNVPDRPTTHERRMWSERISNIDSWGKRYVPFMKTGQRMDHGLEAPFGLLSDCHRRIEGFLSVLLTVADSRRGGTC